MTSRLNRMNKARIKNKLLFDRFEKETQRLKALKRRVTLSCYKEFYTLKERKLMETIPAGWLPISSSWEIYFIRVGEEDRHRSRYHDLFSETENTLPHSTNIYNRLNVYIGSAAHKMFVTWNKQNEQLIKDKEEAEREINAILAGISTVKKLIKEWPEAAAAVGIKEEATMALVVNTDKANTMLGLKTKRVKRPAVKQIRSKVKK